MESKYIVEITEDSAGWRYFREQDAGFAEAAVRRIQERIRTGRTIVAVHIKNPRYPLDKE
jgi:hypothetical protein